MKKPSKKQKQTTGVKEIARRAGVSIATVDRVLHKRPGVSPSTKRRIERIIDKMDYKPNVIASRLASRKKLNLAVLIPEVSEHTDFWQAPLNGIKRADEMVREYGISIEMYFFNLNDRSFFEEQANNILETKPDGVLLAPSFIQEARRFTKKCHEKKIPYVLIDSNIPHQEGLCYIGPHLFRSGFLGGQLMNFTLTEDSDILVMNIAREVDDHNYLSEIEDGFRGYFRYNNLYHNILKSEVTITNYASIERALNQVFEKNASLKGIFVTNSRVAAVARYLVENKRTNVSLIGYDFLSENIEYLKQEVIDMLICHKPEDQGYKGIMTLYRHLVLEESVDKIHFMPIDIVTKENYEFYNN